MAVESGRRQRREWNGEWSGVSIGTLSLSWAVRPGNSGLTGGNVAGVHESMDGPYGVLAIADMLFLAAAAASAGAL